MKTFQLLILVFVLISCKKENIYYYSDNKPIKDSTVIRFVNEELEKLKINTNKKNLKIYTTLDSTSYQTNLDSIRNKIFENALAFNFKHKDRKAFNDWFREKIIVVDNQSGNVVNFYSSFRNKKYDRSEVPLVGFRKLIKVGNVFYKSPNSQIPENYLFNYSSPITSSKELEISKEEIQFLSNFNINNLNTKGYFYNYISYSDAFTLFQTFSDGFIKKPHVIEKVLNKEKMIYLQESNTYKIFDENSLQKILHLLNYQKKYSLEAYKNQLIHTQNLIFFSMNSDHYMIINDGKYTYLIHIFGLFVTNLEKKEYKIIPSQICKNAGIKYYNAIRK